MQPPFPPSRERAPGALPHPNSEPDWSELAKELEGIGRARTESSAASSPRVLLALSGGADSVHLLDCLRGHLGTTEILAVHVNHQLRGQASLEDEEFCRGLCADWNIPIQVERVRLDAELGDLERRAREARYGAIGQVARERGMSLVLAAHHQDDALETLLMRWTRGVHPAALVGMRSNSPFPSQLGLGGPGLAAPRLRILRPLLGCSAEAIRAGLRERQIPWREDQSNGSPRFTRNRVRHQLLPLLRATCGSDVAADLSRFQASLAAHEAQLAACLPQLQWEPRPHSRRKSWRLARAELACLPAELLSRSLYDSLLALTSRAPRDAVLRELQGALDRGATGNWNLRGAWGLGLEARFLRLKAPPR